MQCNYFTDLLDNVVIEAGICEHSGVIRPDLLVKGSQGLRIVDVSITMSAKLARRRLHHFADVTAFLKTLS
ncbi:hypothetical protein K488DRAFT_83911 [Vararia minispora EC-137]|uniref:Uncharacterized protein n=1 Tax=Vararia minispora EC-137 TaxID=1314806 RepID=A0ACB8QSB5_9AGAM|nr:hypothetical protein K488DRAFT_83911 [Vararia minispora EC-137]